MLRPGQRLAFYEWCMTDQFDPANPRHAAAKAEIELGNGLTDIRTTAQCVQAVKDAGFEVTISGCQPPVIISYVHSEFRT